MNNTTREIYRPPTGAAVLVHFEDVEGKEQKSLRTGAYELRYAIMLDGVPKWIYLPTTTREQLRRLGVHPGDPVELRKQGADAYDLRPVSDAAEPPPPPQRTVRMVAPAAQYTNGNGQNPLTTAAHQLRDCLCAAVAACAEAQAYAQQRQFALKFESDDVRASGITLFLELRRNSGGAK